MGKRSPNSGDLRGKVRFTYHISLHDVPTNHHSLGDQFARWTSTSTVNCPRVQFYIIFILTAVLEDDIFKSTVHRAVNRGGQERYSIPLFFGTDYDVELQVMF